MRTDNTICDPITTIKPVTRRTPKGVVLKSKVGYRSNDLTKIDGIGPIGEAKLKDVALVSYIQLARQSPEVLKKILGYPITIGKAERIIEQARELAKV